MNVDDLLSSPDLAGAASATVNQAQTPVISHSTVATSPQGSSSSTANEPVLPEAVPNNADGFNWQEETVAVDVLTDGMAALSVEPTGVGYLGI